MAKLPFRPPPISSDHASSRSAFLALSADDRRAQARDTFNKVRKVEIWRYRDRSDDHCVWCGKDDAALQLDHYRPIGKGEREEVKEEALLRHYRFLGGAFDKMPERGEIFDLKDHFFPKGDVEGGSDRPGEPELSLDPRNLLPSCSPCNQRLRVRMADDTVASCGKHDRFPLLSDKYPTERRAALLHPGEETWSSLMAKFDFLDISDQPERSDSKPDDAVRRVDWTLRMTLILPSADNLKQSDGTDGFADALHAGATISLLGLNRKELCEKRYRQRSILRSLLTEVVRDRRVRQELRASKEAASSAAVLTVAPRSAHYASSIKDFIRHNPHKLAMLAVLRDWLGDARTFDANWFMAGATSPHMSRTEWA
jgi:hypothetical protein